MGEIGRFSMNAHGLAAAIRQLLGSHPWDVNCRWNFEIIQGGNDNRKSGMVRWQIYENRWPTPLRGRRSEWNVGDVEGAQSRSAAEAPIWVKFRQRAHKGVLAGKKVGKKIDRLAALLCAHNVNRRQKASLIGAALS